MTNFAEPDRVLWSLGGVFVDSGQALGNFHSTAVALADVDGDGDLDAFVTHTDAQPNLIWLNSGTGIFYDSGLRLGFYDSQGVALGDLNNDGTVDAFVCNASGLGNRVWLNTTILPKAARGGTGSGGVFPGCSRPVMCNCCA